MNEKYDSIKRMKELMKEKGLTHVFLENVIYTTWPGYDKPYSDDRPYSIREVSYNGTENRLTIWQHWDKSNSGHHIENFEDNKVFMIEKELISTIEHLKKFSVKMSAVIDVYATSMDNAKATADHMYSDEIKAAAYWFKAIDAIEK